MAVIETWFEQDLQKPVKVRYIDGNLFSHNGNGNRIGVVVTNNGEPVTLTGSVSGYAVLADGTTVPCTGTRSGNKASILVPAAAYSPGSILISIFLTDGTTVTTLAALSSSVIMARTGNQISPGSVVTDWTNTINAAMQSVETAAANLGNIVATPYANLTFPVPLGKYTIYNNGLYRCISPIASSEAWTAAHWTNVKLGDDVAELKSAFSNSKNLFDKNAITAGKRIAGGGVATNTAGYNVSDFMPIEAGKTYQMSNNWNAYIYDADKTGLRSVATDTCFTAIEGDAYLRITVADANLNTAQVEENTYNSLYSPYGYKIDKSELKFNDISAEPDNMFNPNVVIHGYLNSTTGAKVNTTGDFYITQYQAVTPGEIYTVSGMWGALCLYNASGVFTRSIETIPNEENLSSITFSPDSTEAFCKFTATSVNFSRCKFEHNIGYSKYTKNVSGIVKPENVDGDVYKTTHIYVGTGCYFTSINAANNAITGNNKHNRFVIHILKGTYNETFRTKNYVDYIGDNKYQCIINYISDNESDWVNRSTIFAETNSKIANLTIRTTGSKYPIHADANYGSPYTVIIEDCIISHDGYQDTSIAPGGTGIGIGLHFYQNVVVRRCVVSGTPYATSGALAASIYCHNDDQNNTREISLRSRSLTIEDCILKDSYYGLRVQAIETVDGQDNSWIYIGNKNTCNVPFYYEPGTYDSWHYFGLMNNPEYTPGT